MTRGETSAVAKGRNGEVLMRAMERAPAAFIGMSGGRNFGKLIVRVDTG